MSIVGATGYTGAELVRLVLGHPALEIAALVGQGTRGRDVGDVLPSLRGVVAGEIAGFDAAELDAGSDAVICALPHGESAPIVAALRQRGALVLDLSADFRFRDLATYETWYGPHSAAALLDDAAYGLCELERDAIVAADLIAVPGCYPTASILALAPLLAAGLIDADGIVVDAKSGVSGAGRKAKASTHFPETAEGLRPYSAAGLHRHTPEIEQALAKIVGRDVRIVFTPHLVPMTRGILATAYARATPSCTAEACTDAARHRYGGSPSVVVMPPGGYPDTLWVGGSNRAYLSYHLDARTGMVVAFAAIDNLVKGAAGQAIQCLNLRLGLDESLGIAAPAVWP